VTRSSLTLRRSHKAVNSTVDDDFWREGWFTTLFSSGRKSLHEGEQSCVGVNKLGHVLCNGLSVDLPDGVPKSDQVAA
jgi:hypothetical protein